jgi:hypothetical protein
MKNISAWVDTNFEVKILGVEHNYKTCKSCSIPNGTSIRGYVPKNNVFFSCPTCLECETYQLEITCKLDRELKERFEYDKDNVNHDRMILSWMITTFLSKSDNKNDVKLQSSFQYPNMLANMTLSQKKFIDMTVMSNVKACRFHHVGNCLLLSMSRQKIYMIVNGDVQFVYNK